MYGDGPGSRDRATIISTDRDTARGRSVLS